MPLAALVLGSFVVMAGGVATAAHSSPIHAHALRLLPGDDLTVAILDYAEVCESSQVAATQVAAPQVPAAQVAAAQVAGPEVALRLPTRTHVAHTHAPAMAVIFHVKQAVP